MNNLQQSILKMCIRDSNNNDKTNKNMVLENDCIDAVSYTHLVTDKWTNEDTESLIIYNIQNAKILIDNIRTHTNIMIIRLHYM